MQLASRSTAVTCFFSFILAYALIVSLFAPFATSRVKASSVAARESAKKNMLVPSVNPAAEGANRRERELLVRFREGVSEQDKATAFAAHGSRRKKQLRGESRIEKLELTAGQDAETAALQLRLNPAVEFAEPNFLIKPDDLRGDWPSGKSQGPVRPSKPGLNVLNPSRPASSFGAYNPNPGASFSNSPNSPMASAAPAVQGTQPDDPRFNEQWALSNTGQSGGQYGSDIGVTTAWQTTTGSQEL